MHDSARAAARSFFDLYCRASTGHILEIGSMDVNGELRAAAPSGYRYTGVDVAAGPGVDVVLDDPHKLPLPDEHFDAIVSSSCFEHADFFWLTFLECARVLRPGGILYINAPSNGPYHPYQRDNWRFYPDAGLALEKWAKRGGQDVRLLESFVLNQFDGVWNDFVSIFGKAPLTGRDGALHQRFPGAVNIWRLGAPAIAKESRKPEDQHKARAWRRLFGIRSPIPPRP
jgi:SAM-dependent methyltransferase